MSITTTIDTITPDQAREILAQNNNNRTVRNKRISAMARDMKAGRWRVNGESLKFNGSGGLLDGQHRLMACVLANKPFTSVVARGLTDADHPTIDVGASRTMADELRWAGEVNVADLAAALNICWMYDQGDVRSVSNATRNELLSYLKKNPSIRDSIPSGRRVGKETGVRQTALVATHYLIVREHGQIIADLFLQHLSRGINYSPDDPCLALRTYALNIAKTPKHRPNTPEWFAVVLKAANFFLTGRAVKSLRWRQVGPKRENFPVLVTAEESTDILDDYADYLERA